MSSELASHNILDSLDSRHLPVLPPGAPFLIQNLSDDSIDFKELAQTIELFPTISARLIALANSAWSSPVNEITSLEMACSRLGLKVTRSVGIALAVAAPFDGSRCPHFSAQYFWYNAMMVAEASTIVMSMYEQKNELDDSTFRTAGLLHNLGLLLLVDQLPEQVDDSLKLVNQGKCKNLQQALLHRLGCDNSDAGRLLGTSWQLPEPLITAMAHHRDMNYQGVAQQLVLSIALAVAMVSTQHHEESIDTVEVLRKKLSISSSSIEQALQSQSQYSEKILQLSQQLFNT